MKRFVIAVGIVWAVFSLGFVIVDAVASAAPHSPLAQLFKRVGQ